MTAQTETAKKVYVLIDYEDEYVQPSLLQAVQKRFSKDAIELIKDVSERPSDDSCLLQWRQYESIDFETVMSNSSTSLANSYIIRKALIRKHYLSATISHWTSKHPETLLARHVKPSVEFELDYSEFLDDALVEAFELRESFSKNLDAEPAEREWWILKPGMSDRGQGIRLFSSEEELTAIFEAWDPLSDDEEGEPVEDGEIDQSNSWGNKPITNNISSDKDDGLITSQLRHFVAQPYIHPPLLIPEPHPSANRKFHIRTYVLAVGALKVYVYKPMLALFAAGNYQPPSESANEELQNHLTNTCLQTGEREGSVHAFWSLPATLPGLSRGNKDWRESVFEQICSVTGEVFEAAARSMSIHLQALPNAFEIFGVDFMVDAAGSTWLLEINAFPDFAQTGDELKDLVAELFEAVVDVGIKPFFRVAEEPQHERMVKVLDIDLGRH